MNLPLPVLEDVKLDASRTIAVVRDDLLPGGTKVRVLARLMRPGIEYVYGSPAEGYAQIALARTAELIGARATVVVAARAKRHPNTAAAVRFGAQILEVRPGYLTVVQKRVRDHCERTGAEPMPFGLDEPAAIEAIANAARSCSEKPTEVWCVAGSGTLARGLALAWPASTVHAVQVGRPPKLDAPNIRALQAPERFEQEARCRPPFPSSANYDAKAWRFIIERASDGALFWNVGA